MTAFVNGISINYEKHGSGYPLLLLHGNGESLRIFDKSVGALERCFTVYAIDSRCHGKSEKSAELHYKDMAEDVYAFITFMKLESPLVFGFSDGAITALLLAMLHPDSLRGIIAAGPNINPSGLNTVTLLFMKTGYAVSHSLLLKLMITEPRISPEQLKKIKAETYITGGSFDLIKRKHLKLIAESIQNCELKIFKHSSHSSYITGSTKAAEFIIEKFGDLK